MARPDDDRPLDMTSARGESPATEAALRTVAS